MRKCWTLGVVAALALAAAGCGAAGSASREDATMDQAAPSPGGMEIIVAMTPEEAQQIALQRVSGRALATDLVRESRGELYYAVTVHDDQEPETLTHTVYVDPSTRQIVRVEDRSVLDPATLTITPEQARAVALARMTGQVEAVQALALDDRPVYEVHLIGRNDLHRLIYVDATTGEFVKSTDLLRGG